MTAVVSSMMTAVRTTVISWWRRTMMPSVMRTAVISWRWRRRTIVMRIRSIVPWIIVIIIVVVISW